ncbi:MAG: hypothetical protein FJX29_05065 [Alphaproteobacteria bacterium]|nr:hypothetical protein [Alphaproteobacteria bacterium]
MTAINDTLHIERQAPAFRSYSEPYWNGTKEKKLLVQYDKAANRYQWYPRATSRFNGKASNLEWREVKGAGEIYSFTTVRRARPPFQGHEPFFLAVVTLPEGVQIMGNTVGITKEEMKIGLKVKPYWHPLPGGYHMLMWQKA